MCCTKNVLLSVLAISMTSIPTAGALSMPRSAVAPIAAYPNSERQDLVEDHFGVSVADPYRWLENDVREDPKVREWVTAQNVVTEAYLEQLPGRDFFRDRLRELYDYERYSLPEKKGGRYFYTKNDGLQNQSVLYVRDRLDGEARLLIDPNLWSQDGATALAEWTVSDDGRFLLHAIQDGGTDWRTLRVLDVQTGEMLPDEVKWVKFSNLAWAKDGSGFFYSRFPEPESDEQYQSLNENQSIYFHRLGTDQAEDPLVFAEPERPALNNTAEVSDDGRWLIVYGSEGTEARYDVTLIDLAASDLKPRRFVTGLENDWRYAGNVGETFYWVTNRGAPRLRLVATDIGKPVDALVQVVPEDEATLESASLVGDRLIISYLHDAKSEVRTFALDGRRTGSIELPGIGSVEGFKGDAEDNETFYSFSSFNQPKTIYRYDAATGRSSVFVQPEVGFDPSRFAVEQRFYRSRDGTRIPLFLVHRRDRPLDSAAPTLLYGYGGFEISLTPSFSSTSLAWVEQGGVYAVANLRGGGEYGKVWHDAGRRANKQNVFDDFIAAAEYLVAEGITTKDQLAVYGRSNGGLLVGAVVNQRPDLFAAALPSVGVMDMLRFDRFTAGRYWVDDYGYPSREADFRTLLAYSPYHNIQSGRDYPAILVTTADTDDRVVPGHSFKYAAALQAADIGPRPHLIRIETRAGHGSGKPTEKIIEEYGDMWAFIAHWTGMKIPPAE